MKYFFIGDVIGFSNIVTNLTAGELDQRIATWLELIDAAKRKSGVQQTQLISDTIFATCDLTHEGLKQLIEFAKVLLADGCRKSLPIRGAITSGDVTWSERLTYGRAVIEAHRLEHRQNWIGVCCEPSLPHIGNFWGYDGAICYPVPMKDGWIQLLPALSWKVPPFEELVSLLMSGGLTRGSSEVLTWPWAAKVKNTIEFRLYVEFALKSNVAPNLFPGISPFQFLRM